MKKYILSENQLNNLKTNIIIEEKINNEGTNLMKENIVQNFNEFKNTFSKQISNTNKIIDMDSLIEEMKIFLLTKAPEVIRNNVDHKNFLEQYYKFLYNKFGGKANELGWGKKKMIKAILGNEEKATETIDTWKLKNIIWKLLELGNIGEGFNNDWASNYQKIIETNKIPFYQKIRDLLINKIYS